MAYRRRHLASKLVGVARLVALTALAPAGAPALADEADGSARERLTWTVSFAPPRLEIEGGITRVSVPDCDTYRRPGAPLLPFRTVRLLLPEGRDLDSVSAVPQAAAVVISLDAPVEVGRWPVRSPGGPTSQSAPSEHAEAGEPTVPDAGFPSAHAEVVSVQILGGHRVAVLRVYPLLPGPSADELAFVGELELELSLRPADPGVASVASPRVRRAALDRLLPMLDNPAGPEAQRARRGAQLAGVTGGTDYLLITKSALVPAFEPLLEQKRASGLTTAIATIEQIKASVSGRDDPERVRNYIRSAYTNDGIQYVLLGGDLATVPCRYAYVNVNEPEAKSLLPVDLYYACLDGSWNSDGDKRWGESTDGEGGRDVDLLAEVSVGRAPVDTPAEAEVFVRKSLAYETNPRPDLDRILVTAGYLGYYTPGVHAQGGDMFDPLMPILAGYDIEWLDDRPNTTPQWTGLDALAALNASPHFALYNGHGEVDSIMRFATSDVASLTNTHPFFLYSVGCNAGQFDNDPFSPDAIGEEFVKQGPQGAFAAILNSRLGWFDPEQEWVYSGEFQIRFFTGLIQQDRSRLGVANQLAKQDLLGSIESSGIMPYRWCYYEIMLFGDPHLALRAPAGTHLLTVQSALGAPAPGVGAHELVSGSLVECRMPEPILPAGDALRHVCTGWTATGSPPGSGVGTATTFTLETDSTLTWLWTTQAWFEAVASGTGTVVSVNDWYPIGTQGVVAQAVPGPYHHFVRWNGDLPPGTGANPTITVTLDQPRRLVAEFAENRTAMGTPEWWLAAYGWTADFESADRADTDADGATAADEYVAGTVPTDALSVLRLTVAPGPGATGWELRWPSVAGRRYAVLAAPGLGADPFAVVAADLAATPPTNTLTLPGPRDASWFYCVSVQGPP